MYKRQVVVGVVVVEVGVVGVGVGGVGVGGVGVVVGVGVVGVGVVVVVVCLLYTYDDADVEDIVDFGVLSIIEIRILCVSEYIH